MENKNTTTANTTSQTEQTTPSMTLIPSTTTDTEVTDAASTTPATSTPPANQSDGLPRLYLADGSMLDGDGVIRPEYLGEYADKLAQLLRPLSASSFQRAFLSKAREANKKKVLYSTKKNCALGMVVQAKKLVHRKKDPAPAILLDMVSAATASVTDDATFSALCLHFDAIYTALLCE